MIRRGAPWGDPVPADGGVGEGAVLDVAGGDADLAAAGAAAFAGGGTLLRYVPGPDADFARALGLGSGGGAGTTIVACDLLDLGHRRFAVNAVVLGVAPDRLHAGHRLRPVLVEVDGRVVFDGAATTVVVAGGQFLRGADLVPRGHPGDGRVEVQVYALRRAERRAMRTRLPGGDHVPHPRIAQASGRRVMVRWDQREAPLEVDGRALATAEELEIVVRPGAVRVLI